MKKYNCVTNLCKNVWAIGAYSNQFELGTLECVDKQPWKMYGKSCYNSIVDY
jgi:hypothetical protein